MENAVGIECHVNRYYYDNDTVMFENLVGGYVEGGYFIPIRFGLKHSVTGRATLYLIVDQQKIDLKKIKAEVAKETAVQNNRPITSRSAFNISVSRFVPFVNGKDVLRYLPDDMLSSQQREAKYEAIAETIIYTNNKNDRRYAEYIKEGNIAAAKQMVATAARLAGYTATGYHGTNGGDFTIFDWDKTQRADAGWFGRGHYFAIRKGEAEMYGQRVITAALKNPRPFNFHNEMFYLNGVDITRTESSNVKTSGIAFAINMANKFPTLFGNKSFSAYDNTEFRPVELKWCDLQSMLDSFLEGKDFRLVRFVGDYYEWMYEKTGDWRSYYTHNQYRSEEAARKDILGAAINILFGDLYQVDVPLDPAAYYLGGDTDMANKFPEELMQRGYTGVLQADNGDEIVIFDAKNIKDASVVTYDDEGNVIPLSQRFDPDNKDIRYSGRDNAAIIRTNRPSFNHTYHGEPDISIITPEALEVELNSAGLYLTSKENSKNRGRVLAYIKEHYPDIAGADRVQFFVDREEGYVYVHTIVPQQHLDEARIRLDAERKRMLQKDAFQKRIHTPSGRARLMQSIENRLIKDGIDAWVESSHSVVRTMSFYVFTDAGQTIKVSDHNTGFQAAEHPDTYFVDLNFMASVDEVYSYIRQAIDRYQPEEEMSTRTPTDTKTQHQLEQENESLREDVKYLREMLALQRKVTGGTKFTKTSVLAAARVLKQYAGAKGDTAELAGLLNAFYEGIATAEDLTWVDVKKWLSSF